MILEKTRSLSNDDIFRTVELIIEGIKAYVGSSLLKHSKTKSMSNKLNNFIISRVDEDAQSCIQGFLMYRVEREYCILYEIHVAKDKRSCGIGSKLMEELFRDQKGKLLILFVHKRNARAQKFYLSKGFQFHDIQANERCYEMFKQN
ncbi:uncharacterized protein VICG_00989 [Vittaforma corneae ATCC 50505]|uniref:N-acetyltransferase domain-containing protein n=1 Tax=Vittaforma corneae (strain ATCC 50505) TaxID=993615 RepID=L2GNS3_VITCO|nr:uncharacterized protein VICG_00989 [Vittaforma corneae ATCC 50505]ELA41972.1 hypothetical protein VICG_00989 [Vittaforma corneae ATCC 50505]